MRLKVGMGRVLGYRPIPLLSALLGLAVGSGKPMKGGKKSRRDRWFGLDERPGFCDFRAWWHRHGKEEAGGHDLLSKENADAAYAVWVESRRSDARS